MSKCVEEGTMEINKIEDGELKTMAEYQCYLEISS